MMTEIHPPYIDVDIEDLEGFLDKIIEDDTLKKTTTEYCTSIAGYIPMSQIYDRPPVKRMS